MKKIYFVIFLLVSIKAGAQANFNHLDINNIKARINADGDLFWNPTAATPSFEVPKGSGKHSIFAGALWIGGLDAAGQLLTSCQTYRQRGSDFFYGPTRPGPAVTDSATMLTYNAVWKINKTTIDSFQSWFQNPASIPGYSISGEIINWPGNGNTSAGYASALAPFFDFNGDNIYDPNQGDYPLIKGDQAIFFVYNDDYGVHTETGGIQLGIEVQGMAYGFNCLDTALMNTIFIDYKVINRSTKRTVDTYIGNWIDFDLGTHLDDAIGCDVNRNSFYVYNKDSVDGTGSGLSYGANPPAQAVVFLESPTAKPMTNFISWDINVGPQGHPTNASHYYRHLQSIWKDGTHLTYGGSGNNSSNPSTNYMYTGYSDTTGGKAPWFSGYASIGVGSSGPFTIEPDDEINYKVAYVFGRDYSSINRTNSSVNVMFANVDTIRSRFSRNALSPCTSLTGISEKKERFFNCYPNPSTGFVMINSDEKINTILVFELNGKLVYTETLNKVVSNHKLVLPELSKGVYLLQAQMETGVKTVKVVVE